MNDFSKRGGWNRPADGAFALPTETWREHLARHQRCLELRQKLAAGEVHSINDLITLNLDIRTFAEDVIWNCEGPELLRAIYYTIAGRLPEKSNEKLELGMSILDPTCGSGACLFAALNILEPLYQACLARMESIVEDHDRAHPGQLAKFADFRKLLERVDHHPNQRYFVLKSIILGNLYGVDIMEEAVEICKLRLFLKLVAEVEPDSSKPNLGLDPLPDIDFNIRAGTTLVGFASDESLKRHFSEASHGQQRMLSTEETELIARIDETAEIAGRAYQRFREMQTAYEMAADQFLEAKKELRRRLKELADELDRYLAADYGIDRSRFKNGKEWGTAFVTWRTSHQPFHWFVEFYGIMKSGGFDVVMGNPPYVEYRFIKSNYTVKAKQYAAEDANNLYAFCMERSTDLLLAVGRFGMIVPAGVMGLDDACSLREVLSIAFGTAYCSSYAIRPSKLFEGVDQRLCIYLGRRHRVHGPSIYTTKYHHWTTEERQTLFSGLRYVKSQPTFRLKRIPQVGSREAAAVLSKVEAMNGKCLASYLRSVPPTHLMLYHRSPRYWIRAMDFEPYFKSPTRTRSIHHFRDLHFGDPAVAKVAGVLLNSSLFFFWFVSVGNGRNITGTDVTEFPLGELPGWVCRELPAVFTLLMTDYKRNSFVRVRQDCEFQELRPSLSRSRPNSSGFFRGDRSCDWPDRQEPNRKKPGY